MGCVSKFFASVLNQPPADKVTKDEQKISTSQASLALERLVLELVRHGAARSLLGDEGAKISEPDEKIAKEINRMRFAA